MANCMAMTGGYNRSYSSYESPTVAEINQLKSEINGLRREMEEMRKLMSARVSFTDFKVFKFNEEEEKRKKEEAERLNVMRIQSLQRMINR
jgi:hypothetical protein